MVEHIEFASVLSLQDNRLFYVPHTCYHLYMCNVLMEASWKREKTTYLQEMMLEHLNHTKQSRRLEGHIALHKHSQGNTLSLRMQGHNTQ